MPSHHSSYVVLLVAALSAPLSSQTPATTAADLATAREQITRAYGDWSKARTTFDRATIERMLAPGFYVEISGQRLERKPFIDQVAAPIPNIRFARYDPAILTIERKGDGWSAVITEKLEYERAGPDGKPIRTCQLWITRDGWRLDGSQWVATSSIAVSNEAWPWGKWPPFADWEKSATLATVNADSIDIATRLFDAVQKRDTASLRALLHPSFRLATALRRNDTSVVMTLTADQYVQTIGRATGERWNQTLHAPVVTRDGDVASIWSAYTFRRGTVLDHCGVVAIQLVRRPAGWAILQLTDTHETLDCDRRQ